MRFTVKLYASLSRWLPAGARNNAVELEGAQSASPAAVLAGLGVPREHCHLVLVNGTYLAPAERDDHALVEADVLAAWPPIAGG